MVGMKRSGWTWDDISSQNQWGLLSRNWESKWDSWDCTACIRVDDGWTAVYHHVADPGRPGCEYRV